MQSENAYFKRSSKPKTYVSSGFILANRPSGKAAEGRMSMLGYFKKNNNYDFKPRVSQVRCHLQGCLKGFSHIVFTELSDRPCWGRGIFFSVVRSAELLLFILFFFFLNLKCLCKFEDKKYMYIKEKKNVSIYSKSVLFSTFQQNDYNYILLMAI